MTTWPNGESYTGYLSKSKFTGWGTYTDSTGKRYRGLWCNGHLLFNKKAPRPGSQFYFTGQGKRQYVNYRYEGGFRDGLWEGYGVVDWDDGRHFEGEFQNDTFHGYGIMIYPNGARYEGQWQFGKRHGHGKYTSPEHDFEGEFVEGKRHGYAVTCYKNGNVYEGYYENDKRHGSCVYKFACGDVFEGTFENDKAHGSCTYTYADGTRMLCTYENSKIVGQGEKYYPDGSVYKGDLDHGGCHHGKGVLILPDGTQQMGLFEKDNYVGPETEST